MVHNPYANAGGQRRWKKEEDQKATSMAATGNTAGEIADATRRTIGAVKSRLRYLGLSNERRLAESRLREASRKPVIRMKIAHLYERAPVVPPEVTEDRNQRGRAARDLTGVLMGDPPRGYSALERRV